MLHYHDGDLFKTHVKALAHCVSQDFNMGKGIAKSFKERFGRQDELIESKPKIGGVVGFEAFDIFIFYLVTKDKYYNKPALNSLNDSLVNLCKMMKHINKTEVAMPRIGCGLDGLNWKDVEKCILNSLVAQGIDVYVYSL
jgi:O-acetyl-ADP-ribose deacetylase (regulator of RNase III)